MRHFDESLDTVLFCNSGSEASDLALRLGTVLTYQKRDSNQPIRINHENRKKLHILQKDQIIFVSLVGIMVMFKQL